jgi:hypothetical protein
MGRFLMPADAWMGQGRTMMRCALRVLVAFLLAACVIGAPRAAFAQPDGEGEASDGEEKGRELAKEAMGHYNKAEYEPALELFNQAREVYPAGQVLRMTGYTLMALERWLEAAEMLHLALDTSFKPLLPKDAEDTQDNLANVMTHLVEVEVISKVAGATVSIDGGDEQALPYKTRMLPGTHRFEVRAPEHESVDKEIELEAGQKKKLKLDPTKEQVEVPRPRPRPRPKPQPEEPSSAFGWFPYQGPIGLAIGGVGLVMGVVGIGVGVYGTSLRGAVEDNIAAHQTSYDANCSSHRDLCLADISLINSDGERAQDLQTAGLGVGIAGAVLFAVGTTLFLFSDMSPLSPRGHPAPRAPADDGADKTSVACGPGGCGLEF